MSAEPLAASAPLRPVVRQFWRDAVFLHWRVDARDIAQLLPPGTYPDVYDGTAWVGLMAFMLERTSQPRLPMPARATPWLGSTVEVTVRLQTIDDQGRRGVVIRAIDAGRLLPVVASNAHAPLPYHWARTAQRHRDDLIGYSARRIGLRRPRTLLRVRISTESACPDPLSQFLTARWGLHVPARGGTAYWRNEHGPWPLYRAEAQVVRDELIAASGLRGIAAERPVSALYSPGVETRFAAPVRERS